MKLFGADRTRGSGFIDQVASFLTSDEFTGGSLANVSVLTRAKRTYTTFDILDLAYVNAFKDSVPPELAIMLPEARGSNTRSRWVKLLARLSSHREWNSSQYVPVDTDGMAQLSRNPLRWNISEG